jgi:Recombinase
MSAPVTSPGRPRRGRPPSCSQELAVEVINLRRQGLTLTQICIALNAHGILTPAGRTRWQKSHIQRLLGTQYVQDLLEETVNCSTEHTSNS